jgi:hypothetical protein
MPSSGGAACLFFYFLIGSTRRTEITQMANYQNFVSLENGYLANEEFGQSKLYKEESLEKNEEIEGVQLEIVEEEDQIQALNSQIEIKEGEISAAESARAEAETEATFEEGKMTEELTEAAATEVEAEEASATAAEDLLEGEEAELGEAVLFWIPGIDVADEIFAGVLLAEAATASALAVEKQAAATELSSEAEVDHELMTAALAEEGTQQELIDQSTEDIVRIKAEVAALEEDIESNEVIIERKEEESELLQLKAAEIQTKGDNDLKVSVERAMKGFLYRLEGMLMEILCLLSLTYASLKELFLHLRNLLWPDVSNNSPHTSAADSLTTSLFQAILSGVALGLIWSYFTRDFSQASLTSYSILPASITSLSPQLFSHLSSALNSAVVGILLCLLITLFAQIPIISAMTASYQPLLSSKTSYGIVSLLSFQHSRSLLIAFLVLLTAREWIVYGVPLVSGGWVALSHLCSYQSAQATSTSSANSFASPSTCQLQDLPINEILSRVFIFVGILLCVYLFFSALALHLQSSDRQQWAYAPISEEKLTQHSPGGWVAYLEKSLPSLALQSLFTIALLLLLLPTLQSIQTQLLAVRISSTDLISGHKTSLTSTIHSLLLTSLASATLISSSLSAIHLFLSLLICLAAIPSISTLTLRLIFHAILIALKMFLQTFSFCLLLALIAISSASLTLISPDLSSVTSNDSLPLPSPSPPPQFSSPWTLFILLSLATFSGAITLCYPTGVLPCWHQHISKTMIKECEAKSAVDFQSFFYQGASEELTSSATPLALSGREAKQEQEKDKWMIC